MLSRGGNMQRNVTRRLWISLVLLASRAGSAADAPVSRPLRVAFVQGNLAQFTLDKATGQYHGVSADIARELARGWRQPVEVTLLAPAAIVEAVAQQRIDIGFVAPTPGRTGKVLYSRTYMLVQQSAFVASDGPIASVSELDRPGQHVGANASDSIAGYPARTLRSATLAESSDMTMREALLWVRNGTVSAFAGNRQRLGVAIRGEPGLRLLPDNIYAVPQAVAVARERPELLARVDACLDEMRNSGFLAQAVQSSGVDGITVALLQEAVEAPLQ